jgi:hypothetical protein
LCHCLCLCLFSLLFFFLSSPPHPRSSVDPALLGLTKRTGKQQAQGDDAQEGEAKDDGGGSAVIATVLLPMRETLARILDGGSRGIAVALQMLAAKATVSGVEVIFPTNADRASLLSDLIHRQSGEGNAGGRKDRGHTYLFKSLLERLTSSSGVVALLPGRNEVLRSVAAVQRQVAPWEDLLAFSCKRIWSMLDDVKAGGTGDIEAARDTPLNQSVTAVIKRYQRYLMCVASECEDRDRAPCQVLVAFARSVLSHCGLVINRCTAALAEGGGQVSPVVLDQALQSSILYTLLPVLANGMHCMAHHEWFSLTMARPVVQTVSDLDKLNLLLHAGHAVDGIAAVAQGGEDVEGKMDVRDRGRSRQASVLSRAFAGEAKGAVRWQKDTRTQTSLALSEQEDIVSFEGFVNPGEWFMVVSLQSVSRGEHSWDMELIPTSQQPGDNAGRFFVGVACRDANVHQHLGADKRGWAYCTDGSLWHNGQRVAEYAMGTAPQNGDRISVTLNADRRTLSFSLNGKDLGIAFGPNGDGGAAAVWDLNLSSDNICAAASLGDQSQSLRIRGAGLRSTTEHLPWLIDMERTLSALGGRMAGALISAIHPNQAEGNVSLWLNSALLGDGIKQNAPPAAASDAFEVLIDAPGTIGLRLEATPVGLLGSRAQRGIAGDVDRTPTPNGEVAVMVKGFHRFGPSRSPGLVERTGRVQAGQLLVRVVAGDDVLFDASNGSFEDASGAPVTMVAAAAEALGAASRPTKLYFSDGCLTSYARTIGTGPRTLQDTFGLSDDSQAGPDSGGAALDTRHLWQRAARAALHEKTAQEAVARQDFLREVCEGKDVIAWLEKQDPRPEHRILRKKQGVFPEMESRLAAVLLHHTGTWKDAQQRNKTEDIIKVWKAVRTFRAWLRTEKRVDWQRKAEEHEQHREELVQIAGLNFSVDKAADEEEAMRETKDSAESKRRESMAPGSGAARPGAPGAPPGAPSSPGGAPGVSGAPGSDATSSSTPIVREQWTSQALATVPRSFDEMIVGLTERCQLLLDVSPGTWEVGDLSLRGNIDSIGGQELRAEQGRPETLLAESAMTDVGQWAALVAVLRSQGKGDEGKGDDAYVQAALGEKGDVASGNDMAVHACLQYVRLGLDANPALMRVLLVRRELRALYRAYGLHTMHNVLMSVNLLGAKEDALVHLRPAIARTSSDFASDDDQDVAIGESPVDSGSGGSNLGSSSPVHFLEGLGGCSRSVILEVEHAAHALFTTLGGFVQDLALEKSVAKINVPFVEHVMWTFAIDFRPTDHGMLLASGIMETAQNLLSMDRISKDVCRTYTTMSAWNVPIPDAAAPSWEPWPPHIVRTAICSGRISKWELVLHMGQTPDFLILPAWFETHNMKGSLLELCQRHTVSSLLEAYDQLVAGAMGRRWNLRAGNDGAALLKHVVKVQSIFRGRVARRRAANLRGTTHSSDAALALGTHLLSDLSLAGHAADRRNLEQGAWRLMRVLTVLIVGGSRAFNQPTVDNNDDEIEPVAQMLAVRKGLAASKEGHGSLGALAPSLSLQGMLFDILEKELGTGVEGAANQHPGLEEVESEARVSRLLVLLASISNSRAGRLHIGTPATLRALLGLMQFGSPRNQRLVLLLLRKVCASVEPHVMDAALNDATAGRQPDAWKGGLVDLLLNRAGYVAAEGAFNGLGAENAQSVHEGVSNWNSRYGHGHMWVVNAAESIALLKELAKLGGAWQAAVEQSATSTIEKVMKVVDSDAPAEAGGDGTALLDWQATLMGKACAALGLLGGWVDCLRVGGRVLVHIGGHETSGLLVEHVRGGVTSKVAFHSSVRCVPQDIPTGLIRPFEDGAAPHGLMKLDSSEVLCTLLEKLVSADNDRASVGNVGIDGLLEGERATSRDTGTTFLRTCALRTLTSLLLDPEQVQVAKDKHLLSRLFAVALRPLRLPVFTKAGELELQLHDLHEWQTLIHTDTGVDMLIRPGDGVNEDAGRMGQIYVDERSHLGQVARYRRRQDLAMNLEAAKGGKWTLEMCVHALEENQDLLHKASAWLDTESATAAERALSMAHDGDRTTSTRWRKAAELVQSTAAPLKLCFRGLELWQDNPNMAWEWVSQNMGTYASIFREQSFRRQKDQEKKDEAKKGEEKKGAEPVLFWACEVCTFHNDGDPPLCGMCGGSRPASVGGGGSNDDGVPTKTEVSWACQVCHFDENGAEGQFCEMCMTPRPQDEDAVQKQAERDADEGLDDENVLEDVEAPEPLVLDSTDEYKDGDDGGGETKGGESKEGSRRKLNKQASGRGVGGRKAGGAAGAVHTNHRHASRTQCKLEQLTGEVWKGLLVVVSNDVGYVPILEGRAGQIVDFRFDEESGHIRDVQLVIVDQSSGVSCSRWYPAANVRRIVEIYGNPIHGASTLRTLLCMCAESLATHSARRSVLSLLLDNNQELSLGDVGGAKNLVQLVKLSAAAEGAFGEGVQPAPGSLMFKLQRKLKQMVSADGGNAPARLPGYDGVGVDDTLAQVLQKECASNLERSTRPTEADETLERESLHPHWGQCQYVGEVRFRQAKAIRVKLDEQTEFGDKTTLSFFADADCKRLIKEYRKGDPLKPFIVLSERFFFRFHSKSGDKTTEWGYRFLSSPLRGMGSWQNEQQVLSDPSLEWACWILEFLMNATDELSAAVHNNTVFGAMLRYLRSPGAPYKSRIMQLLTQLFKDPTLFAEHIIDFQMVEGLKRAVLAKVESFGAQVLNSRLLQLTELIVTIEAAKTTLSSNRKATRLVPFDKEAPFSPPIEIEKSPSPDNITTLQKLSDVMEMTECIFARARLPDRIACEAFEIATGEVCSRGTRKRVELLVQRNAEWTGEMDMTLVRWIQELLKEGNVGQSSLGLSRGDVNPSQAHLRAHPALGKVELESIRSRFAVLRVFNSRLADVMGMLDFANAQLVWTVGYKLRSVGHCIFYDVKRAFLTRGIDATWGSPAGQNSNLNVTLDPSSANRSLEAGEVDTSNSQCLFVQLYNVLHFEPSSKLRARIKPPNSGKGSESLFVTQYTLGDARDWGGVYRDAMNQCAADLCSDALNLFIRTPNGRAKTGQNQDSYMPNVSKRSPLDVQFFEFTGKFLGISLRTQGYFPVKFPTMFYKLLLGQVATMDDLMTIDEMYAKDMPNSPRYIDKIRHCEVHLGISTEEDFAEDFKALRYVIRNSSGGEVALVPGGEEKPVTFANRLEYCELCDAHRLNEFKPAVAAIRRGLACIVPIRALQYFTPKELDVLITGDPSCDIKLLKEHTKYCGYGANDPICKRFWRVFEDFTSDQRTNFIRFTWGRSRLPDRSFTQEWKFRLTKWDKNTAQLPEAHTCFFQVSNASFPITAHDTYCTRRSGPHYHGNMP